MTLDATPLFLDTAYVNALVNTSDQWHQAAAQWQTRVVRDGQRIVTTEFVLTEIGDGLASVRFRPQALGVIDALRSSPIVDTVPMSSRLFAQALALYRARGDKAWGITDCASFVVMEERNLISALTTDDHFRQAGFRALLLEGARA